jgi:poly-gamma-glutamate capsule biosynthesis protein CapA/YwtB (metallophosphatase superfamily)
VSTTGAGRNLAEATAPAVLEIAGKGRVIVFSFATVTSGTPFGWAATPNRPGVDHLSDLSETTCDRIAERVRAIKCVGDVVIASIHWGPNWGYGIPERHRRFAHALIDRAGISIVHGHSSHHPMAVEVHRNRLILYGCGDFLNDYEGIPGHEEFRSDLALMYFAKVDPVSGDLVNLEMTPLQVRRFRLNRVTTEDAAWLRRTLDRESQRFGANVERGSGDRLVLCWTDVSQPNDRAQGSGTGVQGGKSDE